MSSTDDADGLAADDLAYEQQYVSMLYQRLDGLYGQASERLSSALRETGGTPAARAERDAGAALYRDQLAQFGAVENGLCFGRLDFEDASPVHIGRIGIFDDDGNYRPLLMDWRAPAAQAFYLATAASPDGVTRRRHIRTRRRTVTDLDDEVLDLDAARLTRHEGLTSEAALLAALGARRTGRMSDIVETIQAEQDRIIRSELGGVLVVQGGPGTGKTAVALHRAAYLLYTHRRALSTQGVLIVGPNPTFLRYISQVLPSLAETGVLLGTIGDLYPGITARRPESPEVAELKGRTVMTEVLAAAIRDRQRVPDEPIEIVIDRETLLLDPQTCQQARDAARRSGRLHNLARPVFAARIMEALTEQVAARIGTDPYADDPLGGNDAPHDANLLGAADLADIRAELGKEPEVLATLDWLWPALSPTQLVAGLFASPDRLAVAAAQLTGAQRALLHRDPAGGWSPADVPLLDEAAELLGEDERSVQQLAELRRRARIDYAEGVLDIFMGSRSIDLEDEIDPELLTAADVVDADQVAERHVGGERLTAAQRAATDRNWTFGHVIVDEAQELSPMAWRLLMRRCPNRSMTVVGDVAQTGALSGSSAWRPVFEPYVADRWRLAELTVSYRTPAEIMAVAGGVLAGIDPSLVAPRSVRAAGTEPWHLGVHPEQLADRLAELVVKEAAGVGDGRLGVIVPAGRAAALSRVVAGAVPDVATGDTPQLESRVVVLTVPQTKGLEFDTVLVVDPAAIIAESPRGHSDLYVALTRATQRLGVLHPGELPAVLQGAPDAALWASA